MSIINKLQIKNLKVIDGKAHFDLIYDNRKVGDTFLENGILPSKVDVLPCIEMLFRDYNNYLDESTTGIKAVILDLLMLDLFEEDYLHSSVCGDDILGVFLNENHQISFVQGFADYYDLETLESPGSILGLVFMSVQDFIFSGVQTLTPTH